MRRRSHGVRGRAGRDGPLSARRGRAVLAVPAPPPEVLTWAATAVAVGARIVVTVALRQAGDRGPWQLGVDCAGTITAVVLHLGDPRDLAELSRFATEMAALDVAARHALPAPRVVAADVDGRSTGHLALLQTALAGTSRIPERADPARLRGVGRAAGAIHAVGTPAGGALPPRTRPLATVDFGGVPPRDGSRELIEEAQAELDATDPPAEPRALVHGDLWQGNMLWQGGRHTGTVDWDCAGIGPAGIDIGSLRCDAAMFHGLDAADEVLAGWREVTGMALDVGWWDTVAATCTPPDLARWLLNFHEQGRRDLDVATVTARRDAFLAAALASRRS